MSPERWQQIAQLFDEVLERGPDERAAFLTTACADDAELRREVESLLAARDSAGRFLDQSALQLAARREAATQTVLPTGQQIAHFQVLAPLGAGAMGEVYLARDTRLARNVALKLLPERFTQDASRLRRFEREARAASSLNHQNIITVFEVGQDGPRHYIAAEFIAGVTLRKHLAEGPLPLAEALDIANQIAAALEAAHAAGIVHRDIKPENVMVRPDGVVKVLDFGIAKLTEKAETDSGGLPLHHSTEQGTVIGTPGYMSPEQARGLEVDARTDIFSLGVVLYEMIAGESPFRGTTSADAIVALLELEPARLSGHNPAVAPALDRLAAKLLAKERGQRYATIAELQRDLESCQPTGGRFGIIWRRAKRRVAALTGTSARPSAARASRRNRFLLVASLLSVVGVVALGWLLYHSSRPVEVWADRAQLHSVGFLSKKIGNDTGISRPAFSPDGKELAYSLGEEDGSAHLWVKEIASERVTPITTGAWRDLAPVWSPDGSRLAFLSNRAGKRDLWIVERAQPAASQPALLKNLELKNSNLLSWASVQGREWIYLEAQNNLFAFDPAPGSTEWRQVTHFEQRDYDAEFALSPNFDQVVYRATRNGQYCLLLTSLRSNETTVLRCGTDGSRAPVWFPDGHKIAFLSNTTGTQQVYVLWLADGRLEQLTFSNYGYLALALAPDGNRLVVNASLMNSGIYAWDFDRQAETEYYAARGAHVLPEVSPAGDRLLFQSGNTLANNDAALFSQPARPGETAARLTDGFRGRWAPNGAALAFLRGPTTNTDLWRLDLQNQTQARLATGLFPAGYSMPYNLHYAEYTWSPDSAKLVYASARPDGVSNLWQVAADGTPPIKLTNNADKLTRLYSPSWSPDGGKLVYLSLGPAAGEPPSTRTRLNLLVAGEPGVLLERQLGLRLLGWLASQELLVAAEVARDEVELLRINLANRQARPSGKVRTDATDSLELAREGRQLALVARRNGRDNLELVSLGTGVVKVLTNNLDPGTRYGSLRWTADGRRLFYSKQEAWHELQLFTKKAEN